MNNIIKILAGITKDNELYFLEISPKTKEHDYFSMSGFTVEPITEDEGNELAYESIASDTELWKMEVENDKTLLSFNDWVLFVLETDSWWDIIDCSLHSDTFTYKGVEYWFRSGACGQHEINDLAFYTIDKKDFDYLMNLWKKYHLKDYEISKRDIEKLKEYQKNKNELIKKAFEHLSL